jgi:hypothetical protein
VAHGDPRGLRHDICPRLGQPVAATRGEKRNLKKKKYIKRKPINKVRKQKETAQEKWKEG